MDGEEKHTLLERLNRGSDMGPVLRIAGWGLAAAAALAIAIIASRSDIGQRRAAVTLNPLQNEATRLALAQAFTRADEAEREVRKLVETVQTLGADRDKLLNRVASLERSLEDLTGSIALTQPARRPAIVDLLMPPGSSPAAPARQADSPATGGTEADPAGRGQSPPRLEAPISLTPGAAGTAESAGEPGAAAAPGSIPMPRADPRKTSQFAARQAVPPPIALPSHMAAGESPASDVPAASPATGEIAPAASGTALGANAAGTSHGVDLGSATSIEGLRTLWKKIRKGRASALLGDLKPVVAVHDAAEPGSVELRLVAGPVPSALAASRLCGALSAAGTPCRTTSFEGQSLAAR